MTLRFYFFLFSFVFFGASAAKAESVPEAYFSKTTALGFQAGARSSSSRTSPKVGADFFWPQPLFGVSGEHVLKAHPHGIFSLYLEFSYGRQGYRYSETKFDTLTAYRIYYDVAVLPLLLKVRARRFMFKNILPLMELGLAPTAIVKAERESQSTYKKQTENLRSSTSWFDLAAVGGLGLEYAFLPENFSWLTVRYSLGLINVEKTLNTITKNNGLEVVGGFGFWL